MTLTSIQEHGVEKLPDGILQSSLADVAEIVSGFGFPKHLQGKTEGELPFFKVGDISRAWNHGQKLLTQAEHYISRKEAAQIKTKVVPRGAVVFAKIGEAIKLNRRAILGQPSIVDNNVMGLIPRQGLVDTLYLYYYMLTVKLGDISQATTVPSVRKSDVEGIGFPLVPIEGQRCIVAEIEKQFSRLDDAVTNLKRVKANLKRYKAAVLKAAVEGRLVATDFELAQTGSRPYKTGTDFLKRVLTERENAFSKKGRKYREPILPDDTLPDLPHGWCWASWDQISVWVTYGFTRPMPHVDQGVPIVTAKHVLNGKIQFSATEKTTASAFEELSEKDKPKKGDILITKDGTIGRSAIVETGDPFCINQSVAVVWPCSSTLNTRFLRLVIESPLTQRRIWAKARGVAIQHLSITDFSRMLIPFPPLAEQGRIVAEVERRLSVIEELEAAVEANLTRAGRLRQSVLSEAFSGRLLRQDTKHIPDILPTFSIAAESQARYGRDDRARQ